MFKTNYARAEFVVNGGGGSGGGGGGDMFWLL